MKNYTHKILQKNYNKLKIHQQYVCIEIDRQTDISLKLRILSSSHRKGNSENVKKQSIIINVGKFQNS